MRQEQILFNKAVSRVNRFLKFSGIYINEDDGPRSFTQRILRRWFFCFNFLLIISDSFSWFIIINQLAIQEITYMAPCITLCCLGNCKSYYFIKCHHYVIDLIDKLKRLQAIEEPSGEVEEEMKKKRLPFLFLSNKVLLVTDLVAVATFCIGPIAMVLTHYMATNEVKLVLPFLLWYPFDVYDIKYWPFAFVHQFWSAWVTVFFVYGPDCFYYTCCAFIHLQFRSLRLAVRQLPRLLREEGRQGFITLVQRHREVLSCIDDLEIIYGKSTLFNAVSSSMILCVTGFNIMAIDNLAIMAPFTPFLFHGSVQIFLFCYYGELLMRDSIDISDAVYDSEWYELNAAHMKCCLFMLMRAQKPCKITAYGFTDINMRAYTRILSSSWSYFTLLKTMYGN